MLRRFPGGKSAYAAFEGGERGPYAYVMPARMRPLPVFVSREDEAAYVASPNHQQLLTSTKWIAPGTRCLENFVGPADQLVEIFVLKVRC